MNRFLPDRLRRVILLMMLLLSPMAVAAQSSSNADVNGDGEVTVADINYVINIILGGDGDHFAADVNKDGEISVADINYVIDAIINNNQGQLFSTISVTTSGGETSTYLIDQNTRISIENPNLVIETQGNTLIYELKNMARLCYGKQYVTAGHAIENIAASQDDVSSSDEDNRPQYALYTYRNDGDFNAFLNIDVDSITYSKTDIHGIPHPNVVTQQIWTPDSLYRIPLAAIDSIAFKAPETKIKDDVFIITDEHIPYTVSLDSLSLVFNASIPQQLMPSVGNVLVSETFETPYEEGFVGRVTEIKQSGQNIEIICEDANLFDIYDSLVAVGKLVTDSTDAPGNASLRAPRRLLGFDDIDKQGVETFSLGKLTVKKAGWDWISLEYTPELSIDYVLYIHKDDPTHIKLAITGKHDAALVVDCELPEKLEYNHEVWPCDVPLPSFYGFKPTFKLGLFFKSGAKAHVKGKLPVVISHTLGVEYHGSGHFDINDVNIIKSFDMDFKDPTLDFKLDGYVTFGLCADVGVKFLHQKVASIDAILKMGPKITTSFDLSVNDIASDPGIYSVLKNTKVSLDFDMGINAKYRILKKEAQIKPGKGWPGVTNVNQWEDSPYPVDLFQWSWPLFECYLLPEFKSHAIKSYNGSNLTFVTNASREVFLPVKLGARMSSTNSIGQQTTLMNPRTYWLSSRDTWANNYETTFSPINGDEYACRPIVEFLGCQIEASPEVTVSTNDQILTLTVGETQVVDAPDTNGNYTVKSFNPTVVSCTVEGSKITILGQNTGSAYILVTNTKDNSNYFIYVTITDGQGASALSVTPTEINFGNVLVGNYPIQVVEIANNSSMPQTVKVEVTSPFSIAYNESSMSSQTIEVPGNSCSPVNIMFTAISKGDYQGTATFTSNAIEGGSIVVPLHANAVTEVVDNHEWVDLGLPSGTLWAKCNVGASSPEDYGDYFAWGETAPKDVYNWSTYKWCNGDYTAMTKYCTNSYFGYNGFVDNKAELDPEDDAAYVNWGASWRMPTFEQIQELLVNCSSQWTTQNGVNGRLVTGPNGNTLFLPAAGSSDVFAFYWSRTLPLDGSTACAMVLHFTKWNWYDGDTYGVERCDGLPVRAVRAPEEEHEYVDLGLPSGTLWATCNVGASAPEEYGDYFAWGETAPKEVYNWETYKWCNGSINTLTKYCTDSSYGFEGFVDNKTELDPEDDVAYVNWGPSWRMPTQEQLQELCDNCTWKKKTLNGVEGMLVAGPNSNTIFLPGAGFCSNVNYYLSGYGFYWSRTLTIKDAADAIEFFYDSYSNAEYVCNRSDAFFIRYVGLTVRAVYFARETQ